MAKPFFGRQGAIGLAVQTAVGTPATAPTLWLRTRQFLPPVPRKIWTDDEFADGTIFASGSRYQGVQSDADTITFEPTLNGVTRLLSWMLGDVTTNVITPRTEDVAALAPGSPLTVWQLHPVRNMVMQDVQLSNLTLNVSGRQTVEGSITMNAVSRELYTGAALTPAIQTADVLQFMHFYAYYDGQVLRPKDGNIAIDVPMEVQDGAQGEDMDSRIYPVGWSRSGAVTARSRLTIGAHDPMSTLISGYDDGTPRVYKAGFHVGTGKDLEFTFPQARITSADPSNGLGLIDMPTEFDATYNAGLPTFTVSKAPTLT